MEQDGKDSNDMNVNKASNSNVAINRYSNYGGLDTEKIITEKVKIENGRLKDKIERLEQISK